MGSGGHSDHRPSTEKRIQREDFFYLLAGRIHSQKHSDGKRESDIGLPYQSGHPKSRTGIEAGDASRWKNSPDFILASKTINVIHSNNQPDQVFRIITRRS